MVAAPPLKRTVRVLLEEGRLDGIAALAAARARVLDVLLALTYDPDARTAWRAVEAMGAAAERIAARDPDRVREHLRRLLWLLSEESGGICWRAPEAMAEIVARRPDLFGDWVPVIAHLVVETAEEDLQHFRAGMLWAIGRLGPLASGDALDVLSAVTAALGHADPQVRGMAVWGLGRLGHRDVLSRWPGLGQDGGRVEVYEDGEVGASTVGSLYESALAGGGSSTGTSSSACSAARTASARAAAAWGSASTEGS